MVEIVTHSDLYAAVSQLIAQYRENPHSLGEYFRALWVVGWRYENQPSLSPREFLEFLTEAFTSRSETTCFMLAVTAEVYAWDSADAPGYAGWENRIIRQMTDLVEMAEAGQLANEYRHFGIDSPRGSRWYNFDPCSFLECAARGTFIDGIEDENSPIGAISWEQFRDFLGAGQAYE